MSKYILAMTLAVAFAAAPAAAFAQNAGSSAEVKGPPNANGAQQNDTKQGAAGSSSDDAGSNGAASAKATGADKK